jgi:hypothetical protein
MQTWRPPKAVEVGHPAILKRDVISVNYFSLNSRFVVHVTESSAIEDEDTTLLRNFGTNEPSDVESNPRKSE